MRLVVNTNDISISDLFNGTAQLYEVAVNDRFSPTIYYNSYISPNQTRYTTPITFNRNGTLKGFFLGVINVKGSEASNVEITLQYDDNGTWTDIQSKTINLNDWFYSDNIYNARGLINIEFDTPVTVDDTVDKYRFAFKNITQGRFYVARVKNSGKFTVNPYYEDNTVGYDVNDDILYNFGVISGVLDNDYTINGVDISSYGFYAVPKRLAYVNGITKKTESHPKFHITDVDSNRTISWGGSRIISDSQRKKEASYQVGSQNSKISYLKKVNDFSHNHDSAYKEAFRAQYFNTKNGNHIRFSYYGEQAPDEYWRATLYEGVDKGATEIKLKGDYSHWEVGDRVTMTFGRNNKSYDRNYSYNNDRILITSVSYDSSTNTTTVGVDAALVYYYKYEYYNNYEFNGIELDDNTVPFWVINIDKIVPILHSVPSNDYCYTSTANKRLDSLTLLSNFFIHMEGVWIENYYRLNFYGNTKKQQDEAYLNKNVWLGNVYQRIFYYYKDLTIDGGGSIAHRLSGSTYPNYPYKTTNLIVKNQLWLGVSFGIYLGVYTKNTTVENNIYESTSSPFYIRITAKAVVRNNFIRKARYGYLISGGGAIDSHDNEFISISYLTSGSSTNLTSTGYIYQDDTYVNLYHSNFANDKVWFTNFVLYGDTDSGFDNYIQNLTVLKYKGLITTYTDKHKTWVEDTKARFSNFNNSGTIETYTNFGKIDAIQNGNELKWKLSTHGVDYVAKETANTPILKKLVPVTLTVEIDIQDASFYQGAHQLPRLEMKGLDVDEPTRIAYAEAKTGKQTIFVYGIPKKTGNLEFELTYYTDGNSEVITDNWIVYIKDPRDTTTRDYLNRGLPIETLFSEKTTAQQILSASINTDYGADSFGNLISNNLDSKISEIPQKVWEYANRTLTSFGTLIADVWNYVTRTLTGKVDVGKVNGVDVNSINDFKDKNTEAEIHNYLDSYTNKDDWKGEGMNENTLHQGLDSYNNKDTYKADVANLDVPVSSRSSHTPQDVWNNSSRTLTDKNGFTLTTFDKNEIADIILNKDLSC